MKNTLFFAITLLTLSCKKYDYICTTRPRVVASHTTSFEYIEQKRMTLKQAQKYQAEQSNKNTTTYCQINYE